MIAGGDKGKVGTIQALDTKRGMVVVEGVNIKVRRGGLPAEALSSSARPHVLLCTGRACLAAALCSIPHSGPRQRAPLPPTSYCRPST